MTGDGVVLVHGSNLSAACWEPMVEHLTPPVVAPDLPGRRSRQCDVLVVTLDHCVDVVIESADQAGFTDFVLVGHSLGGVVITEVAARVPERIVGLVYVGGLIPAQGQSAAGVVFGEDLLATVPRVTTEERAKLFFANDMTDEQWSEVWQQFVPEAPLLWNARLSGYPDRVPVTYISLTEDVGVPPALAAQMIGNIGTAVDHRMLSCGHIAMVTKPRELAAIINDVVNC